MKFSPPVEDKSAPSARIPTNATALVVDDEALIRWSIKERLSHEGLHVLEAGTAAGALEQAGDTVDLILLDYRLPDSDGLAVLRKVKELYPDTLVILMTAHSTVENAVEAMKLGAFHYINKPFNLDELVVLVHNALETSHLRHEAAQLMAQLREANERLERANHLKDEFLATVSHELRTPLNAVLGWTRMLESKQLPPERAEHALAAIGRSSAALAHMIDDLLDTSRILKGTMRMVKQPVDLVTIAQAALDAVRPLAAARNVQLAFEASSGHRAVSGDAGRLQQVIWNLLANAIKFTPEGGHVAVFVESSNDHIEVRVVDSGQGISLDFLPHVFERFRQGEDATTQRHTGLGLGLGIVLQLVELHGGTVHAASPGLGQGATFTVRLPIPAGDAPCQAIAPLERRTMSLTTTAPAPRLQRLDGLHILVVDDDADERTLASLVLAQAGASVQVVASAREALHVLAADRPDVLVSDIDLSGEDGYVLIRQIRQHEAEHGGFLPALALTGYARAEDRSRTLAAGFQVHAAKPVEPAALTAAIAAMMAPSCHGEG